MKKTLAFIAEIGTIMYVGGILSHIVIGAINAHPNPELAVAIYNYKLQSAYILILPGLGLKILVDLILFFGFGVRATWMKIKLACTAFLTVNAFVFLVVKNDSSVSTFTGYVINSARKFYTDRSRHKQRINILNS